MDTSPAGQPLLRRARDAWVRGILAECISSDALARLDSRVGDSYWEAAVRDGLIDDGELLTLAAARLGIKRATRLLVSSQAQERVSEELARRYRVLPLALSDGTLEIATSDPFDLDCERALGFAIGRRIRMVLASPLRIAERIEEVYRPDDTIARLLDRVANRHELEAVTDEFAGSAGTGVDQMGPDQPVVKLVDHIVADGIASRASDIHLEPGERGTAVRHRVDGVLREVMTLPRVVASPLVSRIKIMARLDIADRLRPQSGRARVAIAGAQIDLRVSTLPVAHGEKVVIRVLDARTTVQALDELGFTSGAIARIARLLDARDGLVLVTGPTGSGKTTTLYAMLRQLQERGVNIVTVEDPVEYRIPGIVQVQVNEKTGVTFASALRSILRQDPDIVLIGEIRDRETAAIAIQAALTGHLVFATLHTIDACTSITRLVDLGVEREKIAPALKGVIAQRLVRRHCASCGATAAARDCQECAGSGYAGRLALAEIVLASPVLERAIAAGRAADGLAAIARSEGSGSLWAAALAHVAAGETTLEEIRRVVTLMDESAAGEPPGYDSPELHADAGARIQHSQMTEIAVGVVDVYVLRRDGDGWRALVLQRSAHTRSPGAWETVHGRVEPGERPEEAAVREVREETGLTVQRLYNATVQPFYLHKVGKVQLAVVFAAIVGAETPVLGDEHSRHEWLSVDDAENRFIWPRSREALRTIVSLLTGGDAGPVEDVLRVK